MAEIYGIELAIESSIDKSIRNKNIYIAVDNQAAIKSLSSNKFTSKMVWNCRRLLDTLSTCNRVELI